MKIEEENKASHLPTAGQLRFLKWMAMLVARIYFRRSCIGNPGEGAVLYVGLHRNGAVDGWIHFDALQRNIVFFASKKLQNNFFTAPFAIGIGLVRKKDDPDTTGNKQALAASIDWLRAGNCLFIYPEGTSTLGPCPLAFHKGAAVLAAEALTQGINLQVIPVGIDYEAPATPGSTVEVIVGEPIRVDDLKPNGETAVESLHERLSSALHQLAFTFASEEQQAQASRVAASHGRRQHRLELLRQFSDSGQIGLAKKPTARDWIKSLFAMFAIMPGTLLNLPLVLTCFFGAKIMSDDLNVVALHRILIGLFFGPPWIAISLCLSIWMFGWAGLLVVPMQLAFGVLALRHGYEAIRIFELIKSTSTNEMGKIHV